MYRFFFFLYLHKEKENKNIKKRYILNAFELNPKYYQEMYFFVAIKLNKFFKQISIIYFCCCIFWVKFLLLYSCIVFFVCFFVVYIVL